MACVVDDLLAGRLTLDRLHKNTTQYFGSAPSAFHSNSGSYVHFVTISTDDL